MSLPQTIQLPEPQYLLDASGNKSLVVLTFDEYNTLIDFLNETDFSRSIQPEKQENQSDGSISEEGKKASDFFGILRSDHPDYVKKISETHDPEYYFYEKLHKYYASQLIGKL